MKILKSISPRKLLLVLVSSSLAILKNFHPFSLTNDRSYWLSCRTPSTAIDSHRRIKWVDLIELALLTLLSLLTPFLTIRMPHSQIPSRANHFLLINQRETRFRFFKNNVYSCDRWLGKRQESTTYYLLVFSKFVLHPTKFCKKTWDKTFVSKNWSTRWPILCHVNLALVQ